MSINEHGIFKDKTVEQTITRHARENGFNLKAPLYTKDGDSVKVVAFDNRGQSAGWPIIAEISEHQPASAKNPFGTPLVRLARFDDTGTIRAVTPAARAKHSLAKNIIKFHRRPEASGAVHLGTIAHVIGADTFGFWKQMISDLLTEHEAPLTYAEATKVRAEPDHRGSAGTGGPSVEIRSGQSIAGGGRSAGNGGAGGGESASEKGLRGLGMSPNEVNASTDVPFWVKYEIVKAVRRGVRQIVLYPAATVSGWVIESSK